MHGLRHTHVSGLIADGWGPVEIAARIGDTLATRLADEFDLHRRGAQRRRALENRYADGNHRLCVAPLPRSTPSVANYLQIGDFDGGLCCALLRCVGCHPGLSNQANAAGRASPARRRSAGITCVANSSMLLTVR
jgi:hypothetical protein